MIVFFIEVFIRVLAAAYANIYLLLLVTTPTASVGTVFLRGCQQIHPIRPIHAHFHNHHHLDLWYNSPLVLNQSVLRHSHHRYCYQTGTYHMLCFPHQHRLISLLFVNQSRIATIACT